jgi:RND superfamily putative drug exporter
VKGSNLAGRAGNWSATHWKTATAVWLAFVVGAFVIGGAVGSNKLADSDTGSGETARAQAILKEAGFERPANESVLVQGRTGAAHEADPAFQAALGAVVERLSRMPDVTNLRSPFTRGAEGVVSADGRSALVQFDVKGKAQDAAKPKVIEPILAAVATAQAAHRGFRIEEFGNASATYELNKTIGQDFKRAEYLTLPITLFILVFAFGALVAAGIPVALAFTAVIATLGLNAIFSHVVPTSDSTSSIVLLIGMAVGVDYSLFYLRREREERARGRGHRAALAMAAATSGQAVLISGVTVIIAMAGMLFAGNAIFTTIGIATMLVVFAAMIGSMTVLPALLSKLGDRVERGRLPLVARARRGTTAETRFWNAVIGGVLRRPKLAAGLAAAALLAAAIPALGMKTKLPGFTDLPRSLAIVKTYERMQKAFPGSPTPAVVVVRAGNVTAPPVSTAIGALRARAVATPSMGAPVTVTVNDAKTVARIGVPLAGGGADRISYAALKELRTSLIPATLGGVNGVEVAVTGLTAGTKDFNDEMKARAPIVFAFVLGLAFLLLLGTFRSLVIPLKAILLNLLSVGASYGILVLVFQHGLGGPLLGFNGHPPIVSWLPLFLFVILFGLSMDYHVFILTRVKELVDRGASTEDAVREGIAGTAGTVSAAAIVMVAVFAVFASLRTIDIKQMGVGLAVAILLDATVIRGVLLPASMTLLGEWNWYLPRWLRWIPELDHAPDLGEIDALERAP